ncbi:hypothetical protein BBSC_2137 [Bifidobacterium scardovii JCM 12489 = DSM 13734]|nr:hypothetical protein BBSC_2137 [Bifidobacterium scardovii JCM 12489 = DSM 13734]
MVESTTAGQASHSCRLGSAAALASGGSSDLADSFARHGHHLQHPCRIIPTPASFPDDSSVRRAARTWAMRDMRRMT